MNEETKIEELENRIHTLEIEKLKNAVEYIEKQNKRLRLETLVLAISTILALCCILFLTLK